jgi:hypothetical protein
MGDIAEAVGYPVFGSVANQEQVCVFERGSALRADLVLAGRSEWLGRLARFPVRALDRPGDDVLEPAEDGTAVAGMLGQAITIVGLDGVPAPRTRQFSHQASRSPE